MIEIIKYISCDKKEFESKIECIKHEYSIGFINVSFKNEIFCIFKNDNCLSMTDLIKNYILPNAQELSNLLDNYLEDIKNNDKY